MGVSEHITPNMLKPEHFHWTRTQKRNSSRAKLISSGTTMQMTGWRSSWHVIWNISFRLTYNGPHQECTLKGLLFKSHVSGLIQDSPTAPISG